MFSVFALSHDHSPVSPEYLTISIHVITVVECAGWDLRCLRTRTEKHCLTVPWNRLGYSVGDRKAERKEGGSEKDSENQSMGCEGWREAVVSSVSGLMASPEQLERVPGPQRLKAETGVCPRIPRAESRNVLRGQL